MLKIVGWIALGLAVLLIVVLMAIPPIAVKVVNAKSGDFLNAQVTLKDIDLNLFRGYVGLEGLHVAQPEGFVGDALLDLAHAHVNVKMGSLLHPPIVISDVRVEGLAMHIIKDTNGVLNVERLAKTPPQPKEDRPEKPGSAGEPPAVALERLAVSDLNVRYSDFSLGDGTLDVAIRDLLLTVTDILFDPAAPVDKAMPGRVLMTARLDQGEQPNARLGVIARLGVLSTNVPAVNAAVRLSGAELKAYDVVLPPGTAATLGGSCLDLAADAVVSPDILDVKAAIITKGSTMPMSVGGTPANPQVNLGDVAGLLGARLGGQVTSMAGNVGSAGVEVAGTAVKSAVAVGQGAGRIVGALGGGLFKAVKGVATGDIKAAGEGLKDSTVGSVKAAVGTVTNVTMTAVSGVGEAAGKGSGKASADAWREGVSSRWEQEWTTTVKVVDSMPYPSRGSP